MNPKLDKLLVALLQVRTTDLCEAWRQRLQDEGGNYLLGLTPATEQAAEMSNLLTGLADALAGGHERFDANSMHSLAIALRTASQVRVARGFTSQESLQFLLTCKATLVDAIHSHAPLDKLRLEATLRIEGLMDRCVLILAASFVEAREAVIKRQAEALREVSTPVITLWDSILLMPLVGVVDSVRAQQISERLLEAIGQSEAEVTLIDVTGVPVMDTSVARHILKTVAAAEMLGTRVVLTGISPSTAQTMVKLGIDMSGVPTRGSLRAGMALALSMTGRRIADAKGD
jgi:rsbT co-antagonist protein RsbR